MSITIISYFFLIIFYERLMCSFSYSFQNFINTRSMGIIFAKYKTLKTSLSRIPSLSLSPFFSSFSLFFCSLLCRNLVSRIQTLHTYKFGSNIRRKKSFICSKVRFKMLHAWGFERLGTGLNSSDKGFLIVVIILWSGWGSIWYP